jgi:hypothetical protein
MPALAGTTGDNAEVRFNGLVRRTLAAKRIQSAARLTPLFFDARQRSGVVKETPTGDLMVVHTCTLTI